ncbi:protein SRG1-like [Abrus precatorius]|uniref:Protein SRG1-like n=1 Tax=Abrus precatorius TaxID=3816 RepID=A0A8B8KD76_ABRPR|nr:protein SRG1-like [Abrus precatorius]
MDFGSSIVVPSVQELAKENLADVPPRYLRPDQQELIISQVDGSLGIPVIDFQNLLSNEVGNDELTKLHLACKEWGFFQLVNHGLDSNILDKIKLDVQDFFKIPISEKKKLRQSPGNIEGFGHVFVVSEEQKLDWSDIFMISTHPIHARNPHLFPNLPLPFRDTLECYSEEINNIGETLIRLIAKALESKEIEELFEDGVQIIRINYYPPCPQPEKVIGLTPHSDGGGLTILLQANDVEGLQIKKDGMWFPIKPLPNAFIVNIGDMLEIITNGLYRSIEHRAVVNSEKERLSIATFCNVRKDGVIGPAKNLISEQTPARFKRLELREYLRSRFSRKLEGKSHLDTLRIENYD